MISFLPKKSSRVATCRLTADWAILSSSAAFVKLLSFPTVQKTLSPMAIASIEYAIANLGTSLIVVLGHTNCGAVKAVSRAKTRPHLSIRHWFKYWFKYWFKHWPKYLAGDRVLTPHKNSDHHQRSRAFDRPSRRP